MDDGANPNLADGGRLPATDAELVQEARRGKMGAFHALIDRHASYLYALAVSLVGDAQDAEDAVQDTLTGAFRGLGRFREEASVKTWLTQILVRQAAQRFRRGRGVRGRVISLEATAEPSVLAETGGADARMDVQSAILALRQEHREVIVLREMQGLSYDEISQALGIPRGTVESRLFRARRELQELLKEYLT